MCTVVTSWQPGAAVRVLAVRDEVVSREFDPPAAWWPDQPDVVGGRDRQAGGSWCVTDVAAGVTALVLNRIERRTGTPSRGVLPLAAVRYGADWPRHVAVADMASFVLVLAGPTGVRTWTWNAEELSQDDPPPGKHVITSGGVDSADPKTTRFGTALREQPWRAVLTGCVPEDDRSALVLRHPLDGDVYATVFGQLIESTPGDLTIEWSRTPWLVPGWTAQRWPSEGATEG